MDKTKNTRKNYGTAYFATAFLAAFFFEFYWIMTDPTDYFMLLGTGFIMIIMGYLTVDSLLKAKADNDAIKNEQNEMMLKAQKAIYIATKKNSKDSAIRQAQSIKAVELMMNKMIASQTALLEEKNGDDINSLIDKLSASNTKLAKEVQSALTVNQLVKANADLVKNVKEALSANAMSLEETMNLGAYVNDAVGAPEPAPAPQPAPVTPVAPVEAVTADVSTENSFTDDADNQTLTDMIQNEAYAPDIDLSVIDEADTIAPDIDLSAIDDANTIAPDIDLSTPDEADSYNSDIDLSVIEEALEEQTETNEIVESFEVSDVNDHIDNIDDNSNIIDNNNINDNIEDIDNNLDIITETVLDTDSDIEFDNETEENFELPEDIVPLDDTIDEDVIDDIISDVSINFEPDTMEAIENEINMAEMERSEELEARTIPEEMTSELDEAMTEGNPEEIMDTVELDEEDDYVDEDYVDEDSADEDVVEDVDVIEDSEDIEPLDLSSGEIPNRQLSDEEIAALFASL